MKISRLGEAPDYRFSLANERTFLAWVRTALGFLAAGVGLDQLAPDFATPVVREAVSLLLCFFAGRSPFTVTCAGCATKRRCA